MKHTTFPNEQLILKVGREILVETDCPARDGRQYVAVTRDGFRTDYPMWNTVNVVWDNPEWFSKTFRERVAKYIFEHRAR